MSDKKRPKQHRIESDSILIFQESLPRIYEKDFLFTKLEDDYGIDGLIQVFENDIHNGEIYYVQIKGKENFNFRISMKIDDVVFLRNKLKEIIVLIAVDTSKRETYWYDIQTNEILKKSLEKAIRANQKSITIKIDSNNILPQNFDMFYSYLKSLRGKRIKEGFIKVLEKQTIANTISDLENIKKKATEINGYKWRSGSEISKDTVLSIYNKEEGELLNLEAVNDLNKDNAIDVNLKFIFPKNEEGKNKLKEVDSFFKGLIDNVVIEDEYIRDSVISTKDKLIHQKNESEKTSIKLNRLKNYKKIILSIIELNIEILFDVEIWYSKSEGFVKIEPAFYSKNVFKFRMNINPLTGEGNIKLMIDKSYLKDFNALLQFTYIMTTDYSFDLFLIENNLKIKIGNWNKTKENNISFDSLKIILEKIVFIQNKISATFKYKDLKKEDIKYIDMVYDLLSSGEAYLDINVGIDSDIEVKEGQVFKAKAEKFTLLEKIIDFKNNPIEILGAIKKIISKKQVKDKIYHYDFNIPEARISFINS